MPFFTPVWMITSTSCVLGRAIAMDALGKGHHVIVACPPNSNSAVLKAAGAVILELGAVEPSELKQVTEKAISKYGRLDILVNTAGPILEEAIEQATPEQMWDDFNMMLSMLGVARTAISLMRKRQRGVIMNFGNVGPSQLSADGRLCAMKLAYSALAESLWSEIRSSGLRSVVIEPEFCRSVLGADADVPTDESRGYTEHTVDVLQEWEYIGVDTHPSSVRRR